MGDSRGYWDGDTLVGNYGLFNILSGARESKIVETSQP
jgi:hypothetical protein